MRIRYKALTIALAGAALLGGCASEPAVEVRPVGVAARGAASGDKLALGHAALAMGNAGLALQEFRQALRVTPQSTGALSGIALCYDAMGRADLARRYYEEALALAPADLALLRQYAASLAHHGASAEAQAVVSEIALRSKAPEVQWVVEKARAATPAAADAAAAPAGAPPAASAITPQRSATFAPSAAVPKARLERISLGEIALVTNGTPLWVALPKAKPARSVRLLNAARREGLAARHRQQLAGAGWRSVAIGNAPHVRLSSLILYPTGQRSEARRLADRLRIDELRSEARSDILVLLGRDLA
jgi:Flp pilus assembly protein TadD